MQGPLDSLYEVKSSGEPTFTIDAVTMRTLVADARSLAREALTRLSLSKIPPVFPFDKIIQRYLHTLDLMELATNNAREYSVSASWLNENFNPAFLYFTFPQETKELLS